MTEEEEEGIRLALDQVEAGQVVPYDDVIRELRSRYADDAARIRP